MAATFSTAPLKFLLILVLLKYFLFDDHHCDANAFTERYTSFQSFIRIRRDAFKPDNFLARPLSSWSKHGYTCIYLASTTDITICMDVELNPGPVVFPRSTQNLSLSKADYSAKSSHGVAHVGIWPVSPVHRFVYSRTDLLRLCTLHFDVCAWNRPRNWKYRSKRSGRLTKVKESHRALSISTIVRHRTLKNTRSLNNPHRKSVNLANLIPVKSDAGVYKDCLGGFDLKSSCFGLLKCRSVCNKSIILKDYIVERNFDLFAITETWLRPGDSDRVVIGDLVPSGYLFYHAPRESRGGGVGVILKRSPVVVTTENFTCYKSFEAIGIQMKILSRGVHVLVIYRPPSSSGINSMNCFMGEFSSLLEEYVVKSGSLLIAGDFNFHIDDTSDVSTVNFINLLEAFNLSLHATHATYRASHILDLIIFRNDDDSFIRNVDVHDSMISDHFTLICSLDIRKPRYEIKTISSRNLKSVNNDAFRDNIEKSLLLSAAFVDVSQSVDLYNSELSRILDCHAPLSTPRVTVRPAAPWYSNEIKTIKRKRRKLERQWGKRRLSSDRLRFTEQGRLVNRLLLSSRTVYYSQIINENQSDQRKRFGIVNKLLHTQLDLSYPPHSTADELANCFIRFFVDKIDMIHQNLVNRCPLDSFVCEETLVCSCSLDCFVDVPIDALFSIAQPMAKKACDLDPLPACLLSSNLHVFKPVIARIVNLSLKSRSMPSKLKEAVLKALLNQRLPEQLMDE